MIGLDIHLEKMSTLSRVDGNSRRVNIAIRTGGGLGDFIVYLSIVDQLLARHDCDIHVFTLSRTNALSILGGRERVFVQYPFGFKAGQFDLVLELDHCIHVSEYHARRLRSKDPELYEAVLAIMNWNRENIPTADTMITQRNVIIFRAKYHSLNRWTQLSCGGVFDMDSMRSNVEVVGDHGELLDAKGLCDREYITVSCGADPDAGGKRQTKVWPVHRFEEFLVLFKREYPAIRTVQLSIKGEPVLAGADVHIRDASLEQAKAVLKGSRGHLANEGGMAHMATQLGTLCVVLFGPTPAHYYGYPQNVNIVSPVCSSCMEHSQDWFVRCARGLDMPECMETITGEMAMDGIRIALGCMSSHT
jgi:hypothetical protein